MSKDPPVSARTLRRHYALLSKVAEKVMAIEYRQQQQTADLTAVSCTVHADLLPLLSELRGRLVEHHDGQVQLRGEVGERLRMIELELEALGAVIPTLPRWTKEQREAFQRGEDDAKTDAQIREGMRCQNFMSYPWGIEHCKRFEGHTGDHQFGNKLAEIAELVKPPQRLQANGQPWDDAPGATNITRTV